jgi:hypothetical protein
MHVLFSIQRHALRDVLVQRNNDCSATNNNTDISPICLTAPAIRMIGLPPRQLLFKGLFSDKRKKKATMSQKQSSCCPLVLGATRAAVQVNNTTLNLETKRYIVSTLYRFELRWWK